MKEKIEDLIPRLDRFKQNVNVAFIDGDQGEKKRRSELSGCAHQLPTRMPLLTVSQRAGSDREAMPGIAEKRGCGSVY